MPLLSWPVWGSLWSTLGKLFFPFVFLGLAAQPLPPVAKSLPPHSGVAVLMYHHISATQQSSSTITPQLFRAHLEALEREGYRVISTEKLARHLALGEELPSKAVVITFDDGYESFYTQAYPELKRRNMPATCFVIVSRVGDKKDKLPKLSWDQMREMQAHGMSFQSHTYDSHHKAVVSRSVLGRVNLKPAVCEPLWLEAAGRRETPQEYRARVKEDLLLAKTILEKELGRPVEHLAWPYGVASPEAVEIARAVGYKYFYYIHRGTITPYTLSGGTILRINAGNPRMTPERLLREIKTHSLLTPAGGGGMALFALYPSLSRPVLLALMRI